MSFELNVKLGDLITKARAHREDLSGKVELGLKAVGLYFQRESQKLVPVDTGALRNSAFTRAEGSGFDTEISVGYTVNYAIYVHENLTAFHHVGQAKFLEEPIRTKQREARRLFARKVGL